MKSKLMPGMSLNDLKKSERVMEKSAKLKISVNPDKIGHTVKQIGPGGKETIIEHVEPKIKPTTKDDGPAKGQSFSQLKGDEALGKGNSGEYDDNQPRYQRGVHHTADPSSPGKSWTGIGTEVAHGQSGGLKEKTIARQKERHQQVLQELKEMPKPKLDKAEVKDEGPAKGQSFAEMKRLEKWGTGTSIGSQIGYPGVPAQPTTPPPAPAPAPATEASTASAGGTGQTLGSRIGFPG